MAADAGKARATAAHFAGELVEAAARVLQLAQISHRRASVEHEQIEVLDLQSCEAVTDLRFDRCVQVVDLVDQEHPVAPPLQRATDYLLAVAVLIVGGGVDQV